MRSSSTWTLGLQRSRFSKAAFLATICGLLAFRSQAASELERAVGLQRDVVFATYSPLASNPEVIRRLLSPLAAYSVQRALSAAGQVVRDQSIDLSTEKFTLYVPAVMPPNGYRLLVFIPPWNDAMVPPGWEPILESLGFIFVSASRSGNEENVMARREPLALLAVQNIVERLPVDPQHIYVGGFSGGSRVAMRLAVGYPDVFRGALLNAGSDPLGGKEGAPLPPLDLFRQFQRSSRIAYVTGADDAENLSMDSVSMQSMRNRCVAVAVSERIAFRSHHVATAGALQKALEGLINQTASSDASKTCQTRFESEPPAALDKAQSLIVHGDRRAARRALLEIDAVYGGLAMPRLVELAEQCNCSLFKH